MGIKLDKVVMSTLHESYKNYKTESIDIEISGSIPAGGTSFTHTFTLDRSGTRADVFYVNDSGSNAGEKIWAAQSIRNLSITGWPHTANTVVKYSGDTVEVGVFLFNPTAGVVAVSTQTYTFSVVQYDAPISEL